MINWTDKFLLKESIYKNPLSCKGDVQNYVLEGEAELTFENGRMRMKNKLDHNLGQIANYVLWCDVEFGDCVAYTWDFYPVSEPGLCMFLFCGQGINGEDLFSDKLAPRNGVYDQYNKGDINVLHLGYYRRLGEELRSFHVCNLRKSYGFNLVSQGADPMANVIDAILPYKLILIKHKKDVLFAVNDLTVLEWEDDGKKFGPIYTKGKAGFRHQSPMVAEYANFEVFNCEAVNH